MELNLCGYVIQRNKPVWMIDFYEKNDIDINEERLQW